MNETIENVAELCGWKVSIDDMTFEFEQMIGTQDLVFYIQCKKKRIAIFCYSIRKLSKGF